MEENINPANQNPGSNEPRDSLLGDLIFFLRKPDYGKQACKKGAARKLHDVFRLWAFGLVAAGALSLLASYGISAAGYDPSQNTVVDLFFDQPFYVVVLLAFVWAPITEELTFRLGLKYSPYRLSFAAGFILMILASFLIESIPQLQAWAAESLSGVSTAARLAGYFGAVAIIGLILGKWWSKKLPHNRMIAFYRKHFFALFYGSSFLFGFVHIFNYYNLEQFWFLLPLLVVPQIIFGIIFAYVRVVYGLVWAILNHFIHNAVVSMPVLVYSMFPQPVFEKLATGEAEALNELTQLQAAVMGLFSFSMLALALAVFASFITMLLEYIESRRQTKTC